MAFDAKAEYKGIKNIQALTSAGVRNSLLEMALDGVTYAKLASPVDSGNLRASIGFKVGNSGDLSLDLNIKSNEAAVGTNVEYAVYNEFGTRKQAPRPFLRPSLALVKGEAPSIVANKMNKEFEKGALKFGEERVQF